MFNVISQPKSKLRMLKMILLFALKVIFLAKRSSYEEQLLLVGEFGNLIATIRA
jgi:hypothetical protein